MNNEFDLPIAWRPDLDAAAQSNIARQMGKHGIADYETFLRKSCEDPDWFWRAFFDDTGFAWARDYEKTLDLSDGKPWAKWFVGGELNWTASALDRHVEAGNGDRIALVWEGEDGSVRRYSYFTLRDEVDKLAYGLQKRGVGVGDRVGLFLPFIPEVAIALLAVARIGAVAVPVFSGFGPEPVALRLNDCGAKALITAESYARRGKTVPMLDTALAALNESPSVETVIVVGPMRPPGPPILGGARPPAPNSGGAAQRPNDPTTQRPLVSYAEVIAEAPPQPICPAFPADHPYMLIYTSGTTGKPKGAVHVHAGFPVKAAQDMYHLFDVRPGDVVSWLTDIGWMMGPWLIGGALALGATCFMYDGSPDFPQPDRVWDMVERHKITVLGITPTLIRALMRVGDEHPDKHPMPSLAILGSTGEPWNPEPWQWTLNHVGKGRAPILNYSGGTEISGGIYGCVLLRPLKPACFNTVVPGVDAAVFNEAGEPVTGEVGYLAVLNVNPGMTRGFWQARERYEETYWSRWPGVWAHGDLVMEDAEGFLYILGRADDTLKIAGKRIGPAEIESVLVEHPAVSEAAVIGVPDEIKGQAAVGFCILRPGSAGTPELEKELREMVAGRMGRPLMPKEIKFVSELPKTRNAKIMRRVIRAAYCGEPTGDLTALENPKSVEEIQRAMGGSSLRSG